MISPIILLTYLLEESKSDSLSITAESIKSLEEKLINDGYLCDFSGLSFFQLQIEYSSYISVSSDTIYISHIQTLLRELNYRTRFVKDETIKQIILRLWE